MQLSVPLDLPTSPSQDATSTTPVCLNSMPERRQNEK